MSKTDDGYTDQQIRSIASALRARGRYDEPERADELDAAVALEWLYRERGRLQAQLDLVRAHAGPDLIARLDELPW